MIDYELRAQEAIDRMKQQLSSLQWDEVNQNKTVKKTWRDEFSAVRKIVQQSAKLSIPNDRAGVWKGVKTVRYKRILGGNVNILETKGDVTMNMTIYNRQHKRYASERTRKMQSYWGASRSFILRFVNQGTQQRTAGSAGNNRGGSGNRGSLTARKWFNPSAQPAMESSVERIKDVYAAIMDKEFYKK